MRLIDAEALTQAISKGLVGLRAYEGRRMVEIVADCIVNAPTIEAKPVVHAHWINYNDMFPCQCSNCNGFALYFDIGNYQKEIESDFCPHCGATMDEEFASDNNVGSKTEGVKIPVISMEDVSKLIEKELPSAEENPILKAVKAIKGE